MTSIRIALAAALVAVVAFAGGIAQAGSSHASSTHVAALAVAPVPDGPVLCCNN